jgi:meso-butanediol dehydrogenase / (S,S)-butanediol dehydrogenase / diacetyl reductase
MARFTSKVALVTGAASGIGRATAIRLASEGATVACVDRDEQGLAATLQELPAERAKAFTCDLLDPASITATVAAVVEAFGGIDVLCNIAGIGHFANDEDETLDFWNRIIGVNLTGTFLVSQAALPHLKASKGNIVNCASTAGTNAQPLSSAYSASKGGVISLTQTMAISHGKAGVRVNAIAPGGVNTAITDQFPIPADADLSLFARIMPFVDMGEPEELAAAFAFLASSDASYINGVVLRVDGGMKA